MARAVRDDNIGCPECRRAHSRLDADGRGLLRSGVLGL